MAVKVGINGFGRVGRLVARILCEGRSNLELAAVNSRAENAQLAHLLKYDSVHRIYAAKVEHDQNSLIVDGKGFAVTRRPSPDQIAWDEFGVDVVLETSGKFKDREKAEGHLKSGVKKVIVGAPGKGADAMFVVGVNHTDYDPEKHHIISNASCTTNCLAPVAKVLHEAFEIEHGLMTTIHAYTMSQRILDGSHKDIRRARAGAVSIIPTSTGAARAVTKVIPELEGRLDGFAIRVPTANVSVVDCCCRVGRDVSLEEVDQALREAADGPMKGILKVTDLPLVSVDYIGCPYSSVVDAKLTQIMNKRMVKILAWYDNEMGFAQRLVDLAGYIGERL